MSIWRKDSRKKINTRSPNSERSLIRDQEIFLDGKVGNLV